MEAIEGARLSGRILDDVDAATTASISIDAAVDAIASALREPLALCRVSVRLLKPGTEEFVLVAVWSAIPTRLGPGTAMLARQTSYLEVVNQRRAVLSRPGHQDDLLSELITAEGANAWVAVPLPSGEQVHGMLSLCTASNAFDEPTAAFDSLGARIGGRLYELALGSKWLPEPPDTLMLP